MRMQIFGYTLLITLITCWSQPDTSVRIARLSYGTCETCLQLALHENAGIGLFAVSADGLRFYLRDAMGVVHVLSREGQHLARLDIPVPLDCAVVGTDGSIVSIGVCQPISLRTSSERGVESPEPIVESPEESIIASPEPSTETETGARRIWVLRSDGKIDQERTDGFNRALKSFFTQQQREHGDCFPEIAFFTGDRLGLIVMAPVSISDTGEAQLTREMGLLILKQNGSWEGLYPVFGASKQGAFLKDTALIGSDAQQRWIQREFDPKNHVEYRILNEDGTEYVRGKAPAYPREPINVRLCTGQNVAQEFMIQLQAMDVLLSDAGAQLDARGRLYLPGWLPERQLHSVIISGQEAPLELVDGYSIARFTPNGQFEQIVVRLKMPTYSCRPWQLWDIDDAGNLYYLEFTSEGIEIRMIPGTN